MSWSIVHASSSLQACSISTTHSCWQPLSQGSEWLDALDSSPLSKSASTCGLAGQTEGGSFERTPADEHLCPSRSEHMSETVRVAWRLVTRSVAPSKFVLNHLSLVVAARDLGRHMVSASTFSQNPEASATSKHAVSGGAKRL